MQNFRLSFVFAAVLTLAACVTVNIYFPSAQAQEAAEQIVEDILGKSKGAGGDSATPADQNPQSSRTPLGLTQLAERALQILVPAAHAAQPDFSVNTPEIRRLQASLKQRHQALLPLYTAGAIGYTTQALIEVRDIEAVALKERAKLKKLIAADNQDRDRLYQAIAAANGRPDWEPQVRDVFAKTWIKEASKGWWYQNSTGAWVMK